MSDMLFGLKCSHLTEENPPFLVCYDNWLQVMQKGQILVICSKISSCQLVTCFSVKNSHYIHFCRAALANGLHITIHNWFFSNNVVKDMHLAISEYITKRFLESPSLLKSQAFLCTVMYRENPSISYWSYQYDDRLKIVLESGLTIQKFRLDLRPPALYFNLNYTILFYLYWVKEHKLGQTPD